MVWAGRVEKGGASRVGTQTQKKWGFEGWGFEGGGSKGGGSKGGGSKGGGFEGWGFEGWGFEGWGAQYFALFYPALTTIFFLLSQGVFSWNFCGFLKRRARNVHDREFSGCRVKPWRPRSRRSFTRQPGKPKRAHFEGPGLQKTAKIPREDPQREKKE